MDSQGSAPAFRQNLKVSTRLCCFHDAERVLLAGNGQVVRVLASQLQKHSCVRASLVRLSGRVQEAWPEAETGRHMLFVADGMANGLQLLLVCIAHLDIADNRKVVPRFQPPEMCLEVASQSLRPAGSLVEVGSIFLAGEKLH